MRIVVVTPAVPHPFGDTAARWFYALIKELLTRGHEVAVLSATEESEVRIAEAKRLLLPDSREFRMHLHRIRLDQNPVRRKWLNAIRPGSEILQDSVFTGCLRRELDRGYDVLHLEQWATGWLGVGVPRALLNVHYFDLIDKGATTDASLSERKAIWQRQRAARLLLRRIGSVRLLTSRLMQVAEHIYPRGKYWVVPLCLDTALYEFLPMFKDPVVGLIGSMYWGPSRSAAERLITRIWPLVKKRVPRAMLWIVGWKAKEYLRKYQSLPDVVIDENISHPRNFFSRTAVMLYAPAQGSGMKVKVMEAMAYGVPVVTTSDGVEGIEHQNGCQCWVAETDEELAERTCALLGDPDQRQTMRFAARNLIEERYSSGPVVNEMLAVYEQLISATVAATDGSCATSVVQRVNVR